MRLRAISFLLVLVMLFSCLSVHVSATENEEAEHSEETNSDGAEVVNSDVEAYESEWYYYVDLWGEAFVYRETVNFEHKQYLNDFAVNQIAIRNEILYLSAGDFLYQLDVRTGEIVELLKAEATILRFALAGDTLYYLTDGELQSFCLNTAKVEIVIAEDCLKHFWLEDSVTIAYMMDDAYIYYLDLCNKDVYREQNHITSLNNSTTEGNELPETRGISVSSLKSKFPHGKYWNHVGGSNNPDGYTNTPCTCHGGCSYYGYCNCNSFSNAIQCYGFALKVGYDYYGSDPRNWTKTYNLNSLKAGDVIRYKNDGHSIWVTAVNGDTITYADCNSTGRCQIRWGGTISKSTINATLTHVSVAPYAATSTTCMSHTKGNYLWYEATHPHYHYWTCSVCGTSFTDGTKATVNSCLECVDRNSKIRCWFSDEEMGEEVGLFEPEEWMYLCYKMYDANTGSLFNSYKDEDYTVTVTIYNYQTGDVEHTSQYNGDDNAWIAIRRSAEGIYEGKVVLSLNGYSDVTTTTYAAFYASTHTIAYDANGGSGAPATQTRGKDATTLSTTVPSRFGYNFAGWSTSATATTASYQPGETFWDDIYDPKTQSYNTVLYAVWEQVPTLSTSTQEIRPAYITYPGVGIYYKFTPSVTTSYRIFGIDDVDNKVYLYDAFGNLLDSDDDGGDGNRFKLDYILTAGKTYYIYVRFYSSSSTGTFTFALARGYTISYYANGGSGAPATSYKYHKINQTLSTEKPARTGYTFRSWNTSASGSGTSYQPGAIYSTDSNITLYAQWEKGCANNNHTYTHTVTTATCTAQGYTTHICTACGYSYVDTYTPALGHSYSYKVGTAPTTSSSGKLIGTCSRCTDTTTVNLPKLNTTDYTKTTTKAATCTDTGTDSYKWKTTTYGTFAFTVSTSALGHNYSSKVTAPTCEAQGYTTYICSRCSHSYMDSYTNATGHSYSYKATKTPTTSATGTLTGTCSKCPKTTTMTLPKLNTSDYTKTTTKVPTCTDTGTDSYKWKTTTYGTFAFTVSTSALGHNYSSKVTAPTCEAQGYTTYICSRCSHSYMDSYTNATGHSYSYKATKTPTTSATGTLTGTCSKCPKTTTMTLPKLNTSDYTKTTTKVPTCTDTGTDSYKWKTTSYGTFTFTVTTDALGHDYANKVAAPTCEAQGYTTYTCSRCSHSYMDSYTNATGHSYSNGSCVNCGAADPEFENFHNPFEDVKEKDYFYTPVLWAVQKGITNGTSATRFSPEAPCTRGQIVTFLWRACGSPEPNMAINPFSDVSISAYYYKAVLWAVENGITTGTGKGKFSPEDTCTRGQVATFLWRAQGKPEPTSSVNPFNDVDSNIYYYNAILWAVEKGVTNGTGKGKFSPDASCTRGQIVTFLLEH